MGRRRALLAVMSVIAVTGAGIAGSGWWTRRTPTEYSRGGAFGSPAPSATGHGPVPGRYVYRASGQEQVRLGALSACGWPVERVEITVGNAPEGTVLDQRIGERLERLIFKYRDEGIYLSYVASTVTCLGIRTTSEDDYEPAALRFDLPGRVGDTWQTRAQTQNRVEEAVLRVERRETVSVPAGTFDTYVVRLSATFDGSQSGTVETVTWWDPTLGIWVKQQQTLEAHRSGARFTSSYTSELVSLPERGES